MFKTKVDEFGWREIEQVKSHSYILPELIRILHDIHPEKVLDFGCGNGELTRRVKSVGFDVTGCDIDEQGIEIANKLSDDIPFVLIKENDPLDNACFDVVFAVEVIEHMFIPKDLLLFAKKHLPVGGYLIITTPYHGYLKNLSISIIDGWDKHHHPLVNGGHIKFFSKRTIRRLVADNGFKIEKITGVGRIPLLWKSMVIVAKNMGF